MSLHRHLWIVPALFVLAGGTAGATPCPNIMLVLDQSGSMAEDPNGGTKHPNKWELQRDAVISLVNKYGAQIPFGLELFTSGAFDDNTCYQDTMISVEPAHDTAMQIIDKIKMEMPDSGTNTGEAVKRARVDPAMADKGRGEYIILVTDGDPNCNEADWSGGMAGYTIGEITSAFKQSPTIHTFVVGFDGTGVNPANLNAMAKAGGEPIKGCTGGNGSRCYFSANSAQQLADAIDAIINTVVGGEFGNTTCDDSCYANGCPDTMDGTHQNCVQGEFGEPHCEPDPCAGVMTCAPGDYCRQGQCVRPCPKCKMGEKCVDGTCIADPCAYTTCEGGQICNPATGQCGENKCLQRTCKAPTVCDPSSGSCIDDACRIITCPAGTICTFGGNCEATMDNPMNGGGNNGRRTTNGCAVGGAGGAELALSLAASLLALFGLARMLRRRR